jgi:glucose-1-phosphate thymidylyltransferase
MIARANARASGPEPVTRAVVLARGLGTRMRRADAAAALDAEQSAIAETGLKAMIPVGRPFLDFVLSGLADAGIRDVCLVVGPEHDRIRDRYTRNLSLHRLRIHFAIQDEPRGTADAVLAAEDFADQHSFLVMNSDNYYPASALSDLRRQGPPALLGFDRRGLVRDGNVTAERIARFALLVTAPDGTLERIVEKPNEEILREMGEDALVSMNCWCFSREMFAACRAVEPSERGELELPHAVQYAVDRMGMRFHVVPSDQGVLDLSSRADIAAVTARLRDVQVRL